MNGDRRAFLDGENHWCDICRRGFNSLVQLIEHDCTPRVATDGSGHVCDACGETFQTLTKLRLHEKDECRARATYGQIDPDADDVGLQAAGELSTCRECGREDPNADFDYTTSFDGEDFHYIVEFDCRHCGFANENRVVMTGVDRDDLDDLPPHLRPDDHELATDGGYPQPEIGDRVTFVDGDGTEHRAVVVDAVEDAEYISLVRGSQGDLGMTYNWETETETSVYPHYTVWAPGEHATHAFIPGWSE